MIPFCRRLSGARQVLMALTLALVLLAQAVAGLAASPRETPVVRAVRAVAPAVVNITTAKTVEREVSPFGGLQGERMMPLFREFFGPGVRQRVTQQSLGSGVVIDGGDGLVLTNAHVIAGASSISVRFQDGQVLEAELVGSNPDLDLAVLRLQDDQSKPAKGLPQVEMGDSSDIMVGEPVIAIGNPYGYNHTVTTGVVSALGRAITTDEAVLTDFIQTDAAINPGNSGGPLLNIEGRLIGVTTAIQAGAQGIGFAIPINRARRVVDELVRNGSVLPVWLGLVGKSVDQRLAGMMSMPAPSGLLVTDVADGSPAARAGVRPGDVVVAMGGLPVEDKEHFAGLLRNYTSGETVVMGVLRDGRVVELKATAEPFTPELVRASIWSRWGVEAGESKRGVEVRRVKPTSPADRLGLKPGDRIVQVGGARLGSMADFETAYVRQMMQTTLLLRVERAGRWYYVQLRT